MEKDGDNGFNTKKRSDEDARRRAVSEDCGDRDSLAGCLESVPTDTCEPRIVPSCARRIRSRRRPTAGESCRRRLTGIEHDI